MLHIPSPDNKRLVWYLAMEEYMAQHVADQEIFFSWIVSPTVIFGRHQVMEDEVNIPFCHEHGVQMYRRKSGGGCVYADRGNLMLSYITPDTHSEQVFQRYLDIISDALRQLGFPAVKSEHNDILIDGHKVSGNACYALPTGTIVHGTLLYNVDFSALQQAITPSKEKLAKHGVHSVRQRVGNLVDLQGMIPDFEQHINAVAMQSIENIAKYFGDTLCNRSRALTPEEIAAIDVIEQTYLAPAFIAGKA
ncbi:MAG: lipoate--protein ligase family protein [Paludibacteraceae bacterium]|nr:lipoate--protein ligase family protein [Paludibacteraceae bacterium]